MGSQDKLLEVMQHLYSRNPIEDQKKTQDKMWERAQEQDEEEKQQVWAREVERAGAA